MKNSINGGSGSGSGLGGTVVDSSCNATTATTTATTTTSATVNRQSSTASNQPRQRRHHHRHQSISDVTGITKQNSGVGGAGGGGGGGSGTAQSSTKIGTGTTAASIASAAQSIPSTNQHAPEKTINNRCDSFSSSRSSGSSTSSGSTSCSGSCSDDGDTSSTSSGEPNLPYPGFPAIALKYLTQDTKPRNWCLQLITNPWFERVSILVILLNCITLGMYQPCVDDACVTNRCKILQIFDDIIFAFFALEMSIKMVAMGVYGKNTYLADSWNRLDFFIVLAGLLEYVMHVENLNLTAIRTIRVLRPLRAINRIPSMRILVMLLLDTLPMLGNVLLLCFFVFFIFGIVGVQLWEGILRQRCVLQLPPNVVAPKGVPDEYRIRVRVNSVSFYYEFSKEQDYICSKPDDSGMHSCTDLPPYRHESMICNATAQSYSMNFPTNSSCVNWNQYYTNCTQLGGNPFQGTISFDNIGLAWVAIFLVISLEGWTDIMYYVQDAHSFWDWIYFVLLIVIGSFFMINLCLVVIATQFSETKKREMERMRQERARYTSTSTLASSTNNSEPATCYAEIVKYIAHLWRRFKRRLLKKYRIYKCQRQQRKEGLIANSDNLTFSPSRIKCHHAKCPKFNQKPSNIQEQMITVMVPLNSNNNLNLQSSNQNINLNYNNNNNNSSSNHVHNNNNNNNNSNNNQHNDNNNNQHHHHHRNNTANNNSNGSTGGGGGGSGHNSSPDISELSLEISRNSNLKKTSNMNSNNNNNNNNNSSSKEDNSQKTILLKFPNNTESEQLIVSLKGNPCTSGFLSPPTSARRRSSVMFNEYVILHTPPTIPEPAADKNIISSEKMTQTGDGTIWQVNLPQAISSQNIANAFPDCSDLSLNDAMTCQELLAFSVAFSAALPTGQSTLESFYSSLTRNDPQLQQQHQRQQQQLLETSSSSINNIRSSQFQQQQRQNLQQQSIQQHQQQQGYIEDYSCCYDLYANALSPQDGPPKRKRSKFYTTVIVIYKCISKIFNFMRRYVKALVDHKYFQQGILLAILINTLSMGIEYHNQPQELTAIVETSNIVFSAVFAVEMFLKVIAEGPFRYIANGFNVFDGVIVILSVVELCQQFLNEGTGSGGGSGLSVLRTFRLLRILKLVRFMPNLRRQLFVMLRTMDNVAVFFSLLVLFIFIFSILGMNLFGCKFCEKVGDETQCDRKNFDTLLWALVTVFQILTQEDWNVVLFNGMEKTSHWAALYFVALMTFGNYVLFNLLVAILVEGFSSERNERREREQRELVKKLREEAELAEQLSDMMFEESHSGSDSSSTNESYYDMKNKWHSAEELRKQIEAGENRTEPKCNIQKQRLLQPTPDYQVNEFNSLNKSTRKMSDRDISKLNEEDRKMLKKTYSIKEKRLDNTKLANMKPLRDPPIITTTAATPQDSPNTTLDGGKTFRNWSQEKLETSNLNNEQVLKSYSSPSLLKPPNIFNTHKILDERLPVIDLIPSTPTAASSLNIESIVKPLNTLSPSSVMMKSNTSINVISSSSTTNLGDLNEPIILTNGGNSNNVSSLDGCGSEAINSANNNDPKSEPAIPSAMATTSLQSTDVQNKLQRSSSFKRFRRSSSKKRKKSSSSAGADPEEENIILNNGRETSHLSSSNLGRNDSFLKAANRIQNDTKDLNNKFSSPQNSIRRLSTSFSTGRRPSFIYQNAQIYHNLNRHNSIKNHPSASRRMSSIELALEKASNLNIYSVENRKSMAFQNSKIDTEKWQKSLSNINVSDVLQNRQTSSPQSQRRESRQHHQRHRKHQHQDEQSEKKHHQKRKNKGYSSQDEQQQQQQQLQQQQLQQQQEQLQRQFLERTHSIRSNGQQTEHVSKIKILLERLKPKHFTDERESYSLYLFPENNRFRQICTWFVNQKWFDNVVLLFIALNCITLAMERPNIPPYSTERLFLSTANYVFTVVFTVEMFVKVVAAGMFYGPDAYFTSGWNIMDGSLVTISIIDLLMSLISESSPKIFGILRVFRLLRSLRPLRVINRAPGLKLVVQTLLSSLRPIGNIVLICCTFFIIFGILGVQLFKGTFYYCEGPFIKGVRNKTDCLSDARNSWVNRKYNFDDLGKALMSLFVLSSRDGWVNIMYTGLDAVGVDQQPIVNYNEWRLLYFIAFILLVGFFVLNMFVGVVVENFHRCREEQEKEEKIRRAAKRALQMEKKRRRMHEPPYYTNYSPTRMFVHNVVTSKYFDLAIAAVIGLNVVTMAMEYYMMPVALEYALKIFNYFFTAVFILEAIMKLVALGMKLYMKDKWNQLDVGIVILSIVGIVLEELETNIIPINPTIIRVMRVLRIARVLKLLKMAKGIRALLDTVMQALPQVGNLGLLFFLLFFIFAALGVELFGRLECSDDHPCQGLGEHAHFANFGMAFLTLFRVATGDNWNGIMKDTLREKCDYAADCVKNCCVSNVIAPIFFVIFVLMAQFVLVNVVVAVLMKHLEESHKQMEDEMDIDVELERELAREQDFEEEQALCMQLQNQVHNYKKRPLGKVSSLPSNFTYSTPSLDKKINAQRRQTIQYFNQTLGLSDFGSYNARPNSFLGDKAQSISEEAAENSLNETEGRQIPDICLSVPGRNLKGQRASVLRTRMLLRERSLDEHGVRRRRMEKKRMSCDNLPWGAEHRGTIFESTESEMIPDIEDIRSVKSATTHYTANLSDILHEEKSSQQPPIASVEDNKMRTTDLQQLTQQPKSEHQRKPFSRSVSTDQQANVSGGSTNGISTTLIPPAIYSSANIPAATVASLSLTSAKSSFLSVPRGMPPRSRSGSTKQLFKQQALDEDQDIDESSLLLPQISSVMLPDSEKQPFEKQEAMTKSDSAEILRIISERRQMDKKDNCGNEDSDYNELLLVKSPHSSMET